MRKGPTNGATGIKQDEKGLGLERDRETPNVLQQNQVSRFSLRH